MNPELRRNLWLEFTVHRALLVPGLIVAIAFVGRDVLGPLAAAGFVGLTGIWGARQAALSVIDEVRERTWDIQRMCALEPWTMTWGKLLGSGFVAWYGGAVCLALYLASGGPGIAASRWQTAALLVAGAIALHGAAMTAALVSTRLETRVSSRAGNTAFVVLLVIVLFKLLNVFDADARIEWYGAAWPSLAFWATSAAAFAVWGVTGAYRAMCTALQVRTVPWLWLAFALFLAAYLLGFGEASEPSRAALPGFVSLTALASLVLSYVAAFLSVRDPVEFRRVARALGDGRVRRALEELPLWTSSAALALAAGTTCAMIGSDPYVTNARADNLGVAALALCLAMVRDIALLCYFSFRGRTQRAAQTTLVYIVVLYGLLPKVLDLIGLEGLRQFVLPRIFDTPGFAVAVFFVQAALASALAVHAWRRAMPALSPPGDRRS